MFRDAIAADRIGNEIVALIGVRHFKFQVRVHKQQQFVLDPSLQAFLINSIEWKGYLIVPLKLEKDGEYFQIIVNEKVFNLRVMGDGQFQRRRGGKTVGVMEAAQATVTVRLQRRY